MIRFSSHADGHMQHASNEEMILLRTATQKMGRKKKDNREERSKRQS